MSCPDCFRGAARDGRPSGTEETLHGIRTYVATPSPGPASESTVIFVTDAFGFNLVNSKLLADHYAAKTGFRVLVPDIIPGGGVPLHSLALMESASAPVGWLDIIGQVRRFLSILQMLSIFAPFAIRTRGAFPTLLAYARAVRAELRPNARLGAAGFCWGGLQTTKLSQEPAIKGQGNAPLIDAHFTAHPAGLNAPGDFVNAAKRFHVPVSIAVGDQDSLLTKDDAASIEVTFKQEFPSSDLYEVILYAGCGHGFAVRADPKRTLENEASERAAAQAVEWFKKYLT